MQRALRSAIRDVDGQGLLRAGQRTEVRPRPVEASKPQQALDKIGRLPKRHAEQHFPRET